MNSLRPPSMPDSVRDMIPYATRVWTRLPLEPGEVPPDYRDIRAWLGRFNPEFFSKARENSDSKEKKELTRYHQLDLQTGRQLVVVDYALWLRLFQDKILLAQSEINRP